MARYASCPRGTGFPDGCTGSPIEGNFQRSEFFTYARQSGQTYTTRPEWNVAGVDYPVGIPAASFPLKDPCGAGACTVGQQLNMPAGCMLFTGGNYFLCTSNSNITIDGYDFSLHNCIGVRNNLGGGATLTIKNSNFKKGSNCSGANYLVSTVLGTTNNLVVENNIFDGDCTNFPTGQTALVGHAPGNGAFTSRYNGYFRSGQSFTETSSTGYNELHEFNYGEAMVCSNGPHAAYASLQVGSMPLFTFSFNTVLEPAIAYPNYGVTAFIQIACVIPGCIFTTVTVNNNVFVSNPTTGTISATAGYLTAINGNDGVGSVITANWLNNYFDPTGSYGCYGGISNPIVGTFNWSGNVNLRDGSTVTFPVGDQSGCHGHF